MKHSKGPWEEGAADASGFIEIGKEHVVAKVWIGNDNDEGMANLRLILKAPELLALVQDLPDFRCCYPSDVSCEDCEEAVYCPRMVAPALLKEIEEWLCD